MQRYLIFVLLVFYLCACNGAEGNTQVFPTPTRAFTEPPQVVYFRADQAEVGRGEIVTLSWDVYMGERVGIRMEGSEPRSPQYVGGNLPPQGSLTVTIPAQDDYYTRTVIFYLDSEGRNNSGVGAQLTLPIRCLYPPLGETCPLTSETIPMTYQPFEHGFMLRRSDTGEVIVFSDRGHILHPEFKAAPPSYEPPAGLYPAHAVFSSAWNSRDTWAEGELIRETLGWGIAPSSTYNATFQTMPYIRSQGGYYIALPDGDVVSITLFFSRMTTWSRL